MKRFSINLIIFQVYLFNLIQSTYTVACFHAQPQDAITRSLNPEMYLKIKIQGCLTLWSIKTYLAPFQKM